MIIASLFMVSFIISGFSTVLGKKFQLGVKNNLPTMIMYNFINAIFGTISFAIICRFHIEMNMITFIYSIIYALMVINGLAMGVISLSKVSIPFSAIIGMAGSVSGATVFGVFLFDEAMRINQIIAMLMLIGAVAVTALSSPEIRNGNNSLPVCVWQFMTAFLTSPFIKIYTGTKGVLPINNMFFMTNLLAMIIAGIYVLCYTIKKGMPVAKITFRSVTKKTAVMNIAVRTVLSNASSVLSAIIISMMELTLYNILSAALGLVLNGAISRFVFREKLFRENYISIFLAIGAIIIRTI